MMFKRRKNQRTDYKQRLALLRSGKPRLVVRRALNNIHAQIVEYDPAGDRVLAEEASKTLKKHGWLGHCGNTSAAYLTGLLVGLKARMHVKEAVLDIGLQTSVKGSSLYAVAAGARDAGLKIPIGDVSPSEDRIRGKHIADYATKLKAHPDKYKKQFAAYLKNNLQPEDLPKHFEEVKGKILAEFRHEERVMKNAA